MSLLKKIRSLAAGSPPAAEAARSYIVDIAGAERAKGRRERLSPGAQVKSLQRIARFTKRESLAFSVLLEGKELRAVQHGGEFQGVAVYFEEDADAYHEALLTLVRDRLRRGAVTVITDDAALDQAVLDAGGDPMRFSTFRKALEPATGSDGDGEPRNPRNDRRGRGRRRRSEPAPKPSVQGGDETVRDLIDLVD